MKTYEIQGQKVTAADLIDGVFGSGALGAWDWWDGVAVKVSADDLATAAEKVLKTTKRPINLNNLDADDADLVLQAAVFGGVIYG